MTLRETLRELIAIKDRLRRHELEVAYSRNTRSLSEYIADIKRRDELEALIEGRHSAVIRSKRA